MFGIINTLSPGIERETLDFITAFIHHSYSYMPMTLNQYCPGWEALIKCDIALLNRRLSVNSVSAVAWKFIYIQAVA